MNSKEKIYKLRELMIESGVDAVIIPSSDPHSSEYVHPRWKFRGWISGFNGSAGTVVVTRHRAGLWTDFRYYIEAETNLKGTEIELFKQGVPGVPTITEFLKSSLSKGAVVGIDGELFSTALYENFVKDLDNITIKRDFDPTSIWLDRPEGPKSKAYDFDVEYCGESREDKIKRVLSIMKEKGVDNYILSSLADIAWLFNIRGSDVAYTPLIMSYAIVSLSRVILFIDPNKIGDDLLKSLGEAEIIVKSYGEVGDYIQSFSDGSTVYYMPEVLNSNLSTLIPKECNVKRGVDIAAELKSVKNSVEIDNIRVAMERDGASLVKFFKHLEDAKGHKSYTEFELGSLLREYRLEMEECVDESFAPIIGYKSNGALCHYSAKEEDSKSIENDGLLLVDSGGQYLRGTTDITRTISMGSPTKDEIRHYTLVLKGHLNISMAKFPEGTTGGQLDVLARQPLWKEALDYGHGTGHGVGFFLGVHEGPQGISSRAFKTPLKEGMITSNEPGLYIEGKYGIRIENLVLTKFVEEAMERKFYGFETLTLYPYDLSLTDSSILTKKEIGWINNYHREVYTRLKKYLLEDEYLWLKERTIEI